MQRHLVLHKFSLLAAFTKWEVADKALTGGFFEAFKVYSFYSWNSMFYGKRIYMLFRLFILSQLVFCENAAFESSPFHAFSGYTVMLCPAQTHLQEL